MEVAVCEVEEPDPVVARDAVFAAAADIAERGADAGGVEVCREVAFGESRPAEELPDRGGGLAGEKFPARVEPAAVEALDEETARRKQALARSLGIREIFYLYPGSLP